MRVYQTALERDVLPLRVRPMLLVSPTGSVADRVEQIQSLEGWRTFGDDRLRTWGLKFVFDGGPESGALDDPYASDSSYRGQLNWDPAELEQVVGAAAERGWRVGIHAIGDRTVRPLLDIYERVLAARPTIPPGTLVIEHGFLANREQRARAIRLGVWVTVQPALLYTLGGSFVKLWGEERTREIMPVRAWLEEGGQLSGGTDYPIGSYAPIDTIWGLATAPALDSIPAGCLPLTSCCRAVTPTTCSKEGYAGVDRSLLRNGMQVVGSDGDFVGYVKSLAEFHLSIDRPAKADAYAPYDVLEDVTQDRVVLNVPADEVDNMGWSKIPAPKP